jgi:hypothetical protein
VEPSHDLRTTLEPLAVIFKECPVAQALPVVVLEVWLVAVTEYEKEVNVTAVIVLAPL